MFAANDLIFLLPLTLVIGWVLDYRRDAFYSFAVVVISLLFSYGMGLFYHHPAPYQVHPRATAASGSPENSFPSQHATATVAFALGVLRRRLFVTGICFAIVAGLVSVARVVVGYHWTVDILAGAMAGGIGLSLTELGAQYINQIADACIGIDENLREIAGFN
ncbi:MULTISPECIES: phosphatase PAP2 family protein [unclassified Haladaptatus]|uniref:phosphatase PAP2 family protein n=1 Tax=unclassified Haladaptatus TaxID=2622732 RepID=UPI00209C3701|nr:MULTISPECIES: phosphatase PAP2 family protein [unclassified Haladaptatus]MCO8245419.1 phosphatase PAP2 family protein [Haladaptatus sp. AB643]MCO8256852.1 phosphatase PAP2 family protein [Haladaptatus sp. AB618]